MKPHPQNCCRHRGDRERELECLPHVQPLSSQLHVHSNLNTLLPQELLTCFTLLHPAQTEPLQPVNEPSFYTTSTQLHAPPRKLCLLSVSYQSILIPKCFFVLNNVAPHTIISTTLFTPDLAQQHFFFFFEPQEYIFSNASDDISTDISFYSFIINMWTNTKLDSHYTSLYSCHQTECNTAQMHIANEY